MYHIENPVESRRTSRTAGQLTVPSRDIFITLIKQADGTTKPIMSSQPLSNESIQLNSNAAGSSLFLLMGLCLQRNNLHSPLVSFLKKLPNKVWRTILELTLGPQHPATLGSLGDYAVALRRPTLFPRISMDPSVIVDAATRGQEDLVVNILKADPSYLLKKAPVNNSVGVESLRTPLQAAIMADDVQLVEIISEHFARLPEGDAHRHRQVLDIYTESLRAHAAYSAALESHDMGVIFKAHQQAQVNNTFHFQPYIEAILNATQAELDAVMRLIKAKTPAETAAAIATTGVSLTQTDAERAIPFNQLTLVQKLNRFREAYIKHLQGEIIFNPQHMLQNLRCNEQAWDAITEGRHADPDYKKRSVIFSQLVGWAQRNAAEPVKQDIRQGTYYLAEKGEPCCRPSRFNGLDHGCGMQRYFRQGVAICIGLWLAGGAR